MTTPTSTLTHTYRPRGSALELFHAREAEVLLAGAAGTGKSRACLEKLNAQALKYPGMRAIIVRKTGVSLGTTALKTWRSDVVAEQLSAGTLDYYGGSQEEPPQYRYDNGSRVFIGGMDKPTKIMSSEYDCVIGGTLVDSPSPIERAYGRPYSGRLVTITTAAGHQLTGTPNHPVLTDQGWVGLGRLREGDHVISRRAREPLTPHADPHVADQPTPIRQIAGALVLAGGGCARTERVETVPMDFHGDGAHGYVDVVTAARLLQDGRHSPDIQPVAHDQRGRADFEQAALVRERARVETLRIGRAATLTPSAGAELAHSLAVGLATSPRVGGALAPLGKLALPLDVSSHPRLPVREGVGGGFPGDAAGGHFALESGHADTDRARDPREAILAREVAPDRIVKINVADAGRGRHVYNLQTVDSWYYANEIVSHNCAYVQEATELTVTDWEFITTRLRNGRLPYQQLIADCNPAEPTHWLKERADSGRLRMIECQHEDNPRLFDLLPDGSFRLTDYGAAYMAKLDALTGVRYLRLRRGQWVAAEGVIFDEFDPAVHVLNRMPAGWAHWPRYWSVDFGFTNPTVIQFWAEDPDGRLYLYRELYRTRRTVDEHARDVLAIVAPDGRDKPWKEPKPQVIVADHDAENRRRFEQEIGMATRAADKRVTHGIETVQIRLRRADDGKPRLFFLRGALVERDPDLVDARKPCSTQEEIGGYIWAPGPDGKPVKEQPLKMHDHGMDAMRYLAVERDPSNRPRMRSLG